MTDGWGDPDPHRAWREQSPAAPEPAAVPIPDWTRYYPPPTAWGVAPPREPLKDRALREGRVLGATLAALCLLGAPLALLWNALAPTIEIVRTASGPQPANAESSAMFAPDGWFVVTSVIVGVVAGAVAWTLLRRRGPVAPVALAGGGLLAATIAAEVGSRLVVDSYVADYCKSRCIVYNGTLHLNATAAVIVLPLVLLVTFAGLTLLFDKD